MTDTRRPKGTGSIREREGRHQATYSFVDATGHRRRRSRLFRTKTEARSWLKDRLAEVQSGPIADAGDLALGQYLSEWLVSLSRGGLEPTTLTWYRSAVTRHIIPTLGSMRLINLSPLTIETFLADKAIKGRLDGSGGLGPASVRRLQVTLAQSTGCGGSQGFADQEPGRPGGIPQGPPN